MHIRRVPGRLAAAIVAAVVAAGALVALALATGPDVPPPPGLLYRTAFIGQDGSVLEPVVSPPPGIDSRPVFLDRDGNLQQSTLDPPPGLLNPGVFIDRDGGLQQSTLDPPSGLLNPGPFIGRDGGVAPGFETLAPPPGLLNPGPFIGRDGEVVPPTTDAPPTPSHTGRLELRGVYPNPFNPVVEISFQLGTAGNARVTVLDARGRLVRILHNGPLSADLHVLRWDGCDDAGRVVAAGSYLFRVQSGGQEVSARGALVK